MGKAKLLSEQELKVYYPKVHAVFFSDSGYQYAKQISMQLKERVKKK